MAIRPRRPKNRFLAFRKVYWCCFFISILQVSAQPPAPVTSDLNIDAQTLPGTLELSWYGKQAHYYFLQFKPDLLVPGWEYVPIFEAGGEQEISYGFEENASILFFRLRIANHWDQAPLSEDFSESGFSNWNFVRQGLNPFAPEATLRRMVVIEQWPENTTVSGTDALDQQVSVRIVSPLGFGMPGGTLVFTVESGPFALLDATETRVTGPVEKVTDGTGKVEFSLFLTGFYEGTGSVRITAGLDPSAPSIVLPVGVVSESAPESPSAFTGTKTGSEEITLTWQDTENPSGEVRYEIIRDGQSIGFSETLSSVDTLSPGWTSANYEIRAVNRAGGSSSKSYPVTVKNLPANRVAAPGTLSLSESGRHQIAITWEPSLSDKGIAGYHILLDSQIVATSPDNRWTFTHLVPGQTYSATVQAIDQSGQLSTESSALQIIPGQAFPLALSAGVAHSHIREANGNLWSWGLKDSQASGLQSPVDFLSTANQETLALPASLFQNVLSVKSGEFASLLLLEDGRPAQIGIRSFDPSPVADIPAFLPDTGPTPKTTIGAGHRHFFAIEPISGEVWAWGKNDKRQLGFATTSFNETTQPAKVELSGSGYLSTVTAVTGGEQFSVALLEDGSLRTWGRKSLLGRPYTGSADGWDHPGQVVNSSSQPLSDIVAIAAGSGHVLALDDTGVVWGFGENNDGQLGRGTFNSTPRQTASQVKTNESGSPILTNAVAISAGAKHSLILDENGDIWSFGASSSGQLGFATTGGNPVNKATKIADLDTVMIEQITAGYFHSIAVDDTGKLYAWGLNEDGQLGDGTLDSREDPQLVNIKSTHLVFTSYRETPLQNGGVYISTARTGSDILYTLDGSSVTATSALLTAGTAIPMTSGTLLKARAYEGTLAVGEEQRWRMPTVVSGTGGDGNAAVTDPNGILSAWGRAPDYLPGDNSGDGIYLGELSGKTVKQVQSTASSVLALTYKGELYGWGGNENALLASSTSSRLRLPTREPALSGKSIRSYSLASWTVSGFGGPHRWMLGDTDALFRSGTNDTGQLRAMTNPSSETGFGQAMLPITENAREWVSTSAGTGFLGDSLGRTWSWGGIELSGAFNEQLLHPDRFENGGLFLTPVSNLQSLSGGWKHVTALRGDGSVWTWGVALLDPAGTISSLTPQKVQQQSPPASPVEMTTIVEVSAGYQHDLFLHQDGSVWSRGTNAFGELGYTGSGSETAKQVPGLSNMQWVAAGKYFSMAGNASGDIWAWGRNTFGELGNPLLPGGSTPVSVSPPVAVPPGTVPTSPPAYPPGFQAYQPPPLTDPDPTPVLGPVIVIEHPADLEEFLAL